jgi:EpsI family protein
MQSNPFGFLKARQSVILTAALVLQAAIFYSLSHGEQVLLARPLANFPPAVGGWGMIQEAPLEKEVLDVLKADDTMSRIYHSPSAGAAANLFIAYFKSQRTGQTPHSPKNCMPGSGWAPSVSDYLPIPIPGHPQPIVVNHYIVSKGDQKSVVLYWYQSHNRVVASEYRAKIYVVLDAIRYNRTDTALVRVVVPVAGKETDRATQVAVKFVQSFYPAIRQYLPG